MNERTRKNLIVDEYREYRPRAQDSHSSLESEIRLTTEMIEIQGENHLTVAKALHGQRFPMPSY